MNALKACWHVSAGLVPGEQMPEYFKRWAYTSVDYRADGNTRGERYTQLAQDAHTYAAELERGGLNWVSVEYLWL